MSDWLFIDLALWDLWNVLPTKGLIWGMNEQIDIDMSLICAFHLQWSSELTAWQNQMCCNQWEEKLNKYQT